MDPMKPFEVPADMRKFAEQSVEQARKAFEGFISAAHQAVSDMEDRAQVARTGVVDVSNRAMSFAQRNMTASFQFAQSLVQAKSVDDVLRLQTEYVKTQIATLNDQAKELADATAKLARDTSAPKN